MRGTTLRFALLAGVALMPGLAHAETSEKTGEEASTLLDEDGQIVVTATRTPIAAEDAPATITVIDAEDIADELATDIKDLVRYEPGVSVRRAPSRFGAALGVSSRAGAALSAVRPAICIELFPCLSSSCIMNILPRSKKVFVNFPIFQNLQKMEFIDMPIILIRHDIHETVCLFFRKAHAIHRIKAFFHISVSISSTVVFKSNAGST